MMIKSAPAFHMLSSTSHPIFCPLLVLSLAFLLISYHLFLWFPFSFLHIILSSHAMFSPSLFSSITFSSCLFMSPFLLHLFYYLIFSFSLSHLLSSSPLLSLSLLVYYSSLFSSLFSSSITFSSTLFSSIFSCFPSRLFPLCLFLSINVSFHLISSYLFSVSSRLFLL